MEKQLKAICLVCGTVKENDITGYCINDHDDWLEDKDSVERFDYAVKFFKRPINEIIECMKNGVDLVMVK